MSLGDIRLEQDQTAAQLQVQKVKGISNYISIICSARKCAPMLDFAELHSCSLIFSATLPNCFHFILTLSLKKKISVFVNHRHLPWKFWDTRILLMNLLNLDIKSWPRAVKKKSNQWRYNLVSVTGSDTLE